MAPPPPPIPPPKPKPLMSSSSDLTSLANRVQPPPLPKSKPPPVFSPSPQSSRAPRRDSLDTEARAVVISGGPGKAPGVAVPASVETDQAAVSSRPVGAIIDDDDEDLASNHGDGDGDDVENGGGDADTRDRRRLPPPGNVDLAIMDDDDDDDDDSRSNNNDSGQIKNETKNGVVGADPSRAREYASECASECAAVSRRDTAAPTAAVGKGASSPASAAPSQRYADRLASTSHVLSKRCAYLESTLASLRTASRLRVESSQRVRERLRALPGLLTSNLAALVESETLSSGRFVLSSNAAALAVDERCASLALHLGAVLDAEARTIALEAARDASRTLRDTAVAEMTAYTRLLGAYLENESNGTVALAPLRGSEAERVRAAVEGCVAPTFFESPGLPFGSMRVVSALALRNDAVAERFAAEVGARGEAAVVRGLFASVADDEIEHLAVYGFTRFNERTSRARAASAGRRGAGGGRAPTPVGAPTGIYDGATSSLFDEDGGYTASREDDLPELAEDVDDEASLRRAVHRLLHAKFWQRDSQSREYVRAVLRKSYPCSLPRLFSKWSTCTDRADALQRRRIDPANARKPELAYVCLAKALVSRVCSAADETRRSAAGDGAVPDAVAFPRHDEYKMLRSAAVLPEYLVLVEYLPRPELEPESLIPGSTAAGEADGRYLAVDLTVDHSGDDTAAWNVLRRESSLVPMRSIAPSEGASKGPGSNAVSNAMPQAGAYPHSASSARPSSSAAVDHGTAAEAAAAAAAATAAEAAAAAAAATADGYDALLDVDPVPPPLAPPVPVLNPRPLSLLATRASGRSSAARRKEDSARGSSAHGSSGRKSARGKGASSKDAHPKAGRTADFAEARRNAQRVRGAISRTVDSVVRSYWSVIDRERGAEWNSSRGALHNVRVARLKVQIEEMRNELAKTRQGEEEY